MEIDITKTLIERRCKKCGYSLHSPAGHFYITDYDNTVCILYFTCLRCGRVSKSYVFVETGEVKDIE